MPLIDYLYSPGPSCRVGAGFGQNEFNSAGSSMSAPQVAGATALYRAHRPTASAQETRAALLLTTIDPRLKVDGTHLERYTHFDRNAIGVGYTRDDLVARYATRTGTTSIGQPVNLTQQSPEATITWTVSPGLHAAAIAWPRVYDPGFEPASGVVVPWANVDLEVLIPPSTILARSDSPRNTYERVTFGVPDGVTSIQLKVRAVDMPTSSVPVYVAARPLSGDTTAYTSKRSHSGYVTSIGQETGCSATVQDQTIARVVPNTYTQAYGSGPFLMTGSPRTSDETFQRNFIARPAGQGEWRSDNVYSPAVLGIPATGFTFRAVAFRAWDSFVNCDAAIKINQLWVYSPSRPPNTPIEAYLAGINQPPSQPQDVPVKVVDNLNISLKRPSWAARTWDTWPIIIPFATPYTLASPTSYLGVWMSTTTVSPTGCWFAVDEVNDGTGDYASATSLWGSVLHVGQALVLGLMTGESVTRPPILDLLGFPESIPGPGRDVLFQVRSAGSATTATVLLGTTNPNVLLPSGCRQLTSGNIVALPAIQTSPMGDGNVLWNPNSPVLLNQQVFAQAWTSTGLLSNGLKLTIGGIVP
jgi:hypothetical protein